MSKHKFILTIAGHDPSGGAGITSDIKAFEAHGVYALSVCTAVTVQNDIKFKSCSWVTTDIVMAQIDILFEQFEILVVKIGIIESWQSLLLVLEKLHAHNPEIKVVLDPILTASAGFDFHSNEEQSVLDNIWQLCYIITPNYDEIQNLYPEMTIEETLNHISNLTNVYLKGGHRAYKKGWDELYHSSIVVVNIPPNTAEVFEKHGSGCVFSSALASNIALEIELEDACRNAKLYTEQFLNSHTSLLGIHHKTVLT
ncbi:hydroxymethylpyrimidine/phosphomethylpyrimidine kinase [Gelidibacter salicanalis]|uniref:hydroxymethylpyrimidine kinase n=1 Tax=Gelidibacter salicanalis TaxID=291193 RepID=A0A5C7AHP9_9FLAO|nr:hydroxymethylpyrimidine/phosphomethylpyrimidine kinase [Gelidibacter salicanalis]TXE07931.1 hydroxymethylpyrimidine/phosphomethylpyrimidine kinase [Gelidibacter salicanalis]